MPFSILPITDFLHIKDIAVDTESADRAVNKYSTESTNNNSSSVNGKQEIKPIESDILNEMENLFANTVTNIATVFSNEQYKIPAIITNSADMAI